MFPFGGEINNGDERFLSLGDASVSGGIYERLEGATRCTFLGTRFYPNNPRKFSWFESGDEMMPIFNTCL